MHKTIVLIHLAIASGLMAQPPVVTTGLDGQCAGDAVRTGRTRTARIRRPRSRWASAATAAPARTVTCRPTASNCRPPTPRLATSRSSSAGRFDPKADDPLFRPIDADDFRIHGANASDFTTLRRNGLIRITLPLPRQCQAHRPRHQPAFRRNVRGRLARRSVRQQRRADRTRWPRLRGARAESRGRLPTWTRASPRFRIKRYRPSSTTPRCRGRPPSRTLDDLAAFQLTLFSSPGVRALANAIGTGITPLPDPDPPLTALEQQGKAVFIRACAQCHGGPGNSTTSPPIVARFHDIATACPAPSRYRLAAALRFRGLSRRNLGQSANLRVHARERHERYGAPARTRGARS